MVISMSQSKKGTEKQKEITTRTENPASGPRLKGSFHQIYRLKGE